MNEVTVRNLTPRELAESMRYSDDVATRALAMHVIDNDICANDAEDKIAEIEDEKRIAQGKCDDLKELLDDCMQELPDSEAGRELRARIQAWIT